MSKAKYSCGAVTLVEVPYLNAARTVRRPALIVCDPSQMLDLIVAAISSRIRSPLPPTHYLIDTSHSDWSSSGLAKPSVVRCDRLYTIEYDELYRMLGSLSDATMKQLNGVLMRALGIP